MDKLSHQSSAKNLGRKFLPGHPDFDIRYPLIIGLSLVLLATIAFVRAAGIAELQNSITLSNGEVVRLGESKAELAASLKADLHVVNSEFYQYPADPKKPVEAHIFVQAERVRAIEIINGEASHSSGLKLGINNPEVMSRLSQRFQGLDQKFALLKYKGVTIDQVNSRLTFLTPTCQASSRIVSMVLADKDYLPALQQKFTPTDCSALSD